MKLSEAEYARIAARGPGEVTHVCAADAPLMSITFTLPFPPSVNTYWRHMVLGGKFKKAQARVYLSEQGKNYRTHAILSMNVQRVPKRALQGRLAVHVIAYPPDRRARDLDNLPKGVLDALKHAEIIVDDSHIDDLRIVRGLVRPDGLLQMRITELTREPQIVELDLGADAVIIQEHARRPIRAPRSKTEPFTGEKPPF